MDSVEPRISDDQNSTLLRKVTHEEVRKALFNMHPDKSPGPDGLNPGFYHAYWDIVSQDLVSLCENFFQNGALPTGINCTQITLIPKKSVPETMSDLRPISLCNVAYKVIAKVAVDRMKILLDDIISHNQSAFVPGRLITDNIIVAHETQHFLAHKRQGKVGYAALKLDMSKAFDRVE